LIIIIAIIGKNDNIRTKYRGGRMYNIEDRLSNIIEYFCKVNGLNKDSLIAFIKKRENRYLLLLILKKYGNINDERVKELLGIKDRSINNNLKRAEEKILISKNFREKYFQIDGIINKII